MLAELISRRLRRRYRTVVDLDRPRLGLTERQVAEGLRPCGRVNVVWKKQSNGGRDAVTPGPVTEKE